MFFKLILLAGQEDKAGALPSIFDISLELFLKESEIKKSIMHLLDAGLLYENDNGDITVTNFEKRQSQGLSDAERSKRYRDNKKNVTHQCDERHANVTKQCDENQKIVTLDKEIEIEKEKEVEIDNKKEIEKEKNCVTERHDTHSQKKCYGTFQNVLLTEDEYQKLHEKFPDADERIEALSIGIDSKGYKYKNHYSTILNWARREEKNPQPSFSGSTGQLKKPVDASGMTPDEVRNNGNLFSSATEMLRALNAAKERQKNEVVDL